MTSAHGSVAEDDRTRTRIGISPDSWGVWFPEHRRQPPWRDFLDGAAAAGYRAIELGPFGYLPTDETALRRELAARDLTLVGAFVAADLDRAADGHVSDIVLKTAALTASAGGEQMLVMGQPFVDLETGLSLRGRDEDRDQERARMGLAHLVTRFASLGLHTVVHPHPYTDIASGTEVGAALDDVPNLELCIDVGQLMYVDEDPLVLTQRWLDRVSNVHLKDVDADVLRSTRSAGTSLVESIAAGVFTEIGRGSADIASLCDVLRSIQWSGWWVVEQPLFPVVGSDPLSSAIANAEALDELLHRRSRGIVRN